MTRTLLDQRLGSATTWIDLARIVEAARATPENFGLTADADIVAQAAAACRTSSASIWNHLAALDAKTLLIPGLSDAEATKISVTRLAAARTFLRKRPDLRTEIAHVLLDPDVSRRGMGPAIERLAARKPEGQSPTSTRAKDLEARLKAYLEAYPEALGFDQSVTIDTGQQEQLVRTDLLVIAENGQSVAAIEVKSPRVSDRGLNVTGWLGQLMLLAHIHGSSWLVVPADAEVLATKAKLAAEHLQLEGIQFGLFDDSDDIVETSFRRI